MPGLRIVNISSHLDAIKELTAVGVDDIGMKLMAPKMVHLNIKLDSITCTQANILKQELLSLGGDAAVSRGVVNHKVDRTDCVLMGTIKQFERLSRKLRIQPFGLKNIAVELRTLLNSIISVPSLIVTKKMTLEFDKRSYVMGILNVTPDSFSERETYLDTDSAVRRGLEMVEEGADIIDIGGESTRPGAEPVSAEDELKRVIPVIERLAPMVGVPISVDTYKAEVAKQALKEGADIINDISGLRFDARMAETAASFNAPLIIMHTKGTPKEMQTAPAYHSLVREILDYLEEGVKIAESAGIAKDKIIVDPGIGFGKTLEHNLTIMKNLEAFRSLGKPLLVGTSRKSFIGKITGADIENRIPGTAATISAAVMKGANILRVHDVREGVQAARMADAIKSAEN